VDFLPGDSTRRSKSKLSRDRCEYRAVDHGRAGSPRRSALLGVRWLLWGRKESPPSSAFGGHFTW